MLAWSVPADRQPEVAMPSCWEASRRQRGFGHCLPSISIVAVTVLWQEAFQAQERPSVLMHLASCVGCDSEEGLRIAR